MEMGSNHNLLMLKLQIHLLLELIGLNSTIWHPIFYLPLGSTALMTLTSWLILSPQKLAVDRATTKKPANKFYKLDPPPSPYFNY